jgi:hypothetical protein
LRVEANQAIIRESEDAFKHRTRDGNFSNYGKSIGQQKGVRAGANGHQDRSDLAGDNEAIETAQGAGWIRVLTDLDNTSLGGTGEADQHYRIPE